MLAKAMNPSWSNNAMGVDRGPPYYPVLQEFNSSRSQALARSRQLILASLDAM